MCGSDKTVRKREVPRPMLGVMNMVCRRFPVELFDGGLESSRSLEVFLEPKRNVSLSLPISLRGPCSMDSASESTFVNG